MGEVPADAFVQAIKSDWRKAPLGTVDRTLCEYAEKLTRAPAEMSRADIEALRKVGLSDRAIHDVVQVVSYFNYINRVADALGTDPEDFYPPRQRATERANADRPLDEESGQVEGPPWPDARSS